MVNTVGYQHFENSVHKRPQQRGRDKMPRRVNVVAAASYVRKIFESKKLAYSIMGGFQMSCLGNGREVSSIQIAYEDRDFDRIKKKLEADQRIQLPGGMNPLTPTKILVQTGPWYKDAACTACATIEVYLLPPGSYGTPPSGTLKNNVVLLSDNTGGVLRTFNGLNMLYLVKTLIQFCKSHDLGWSPLEDLLLLCQRYGGQIQAVRDQLDQIAIHQNFLNTPFFSRLPAEDQRRCFQILAGQMLPSHPAMGTPSPQNSQPRSQSTLEVQKTRMSLYNNSAPRLNTTFAHGLPNTQLVQSEQPAQMHASKINLPWMNLPSSPREAEANIPSGDSRSRYRRISTCNVRRVTSGPQLSGNSSKESLHETYASQKTSPVNVPSLQQSHSHTQVSTKANALPTALSIQQRDNATKPGARNVGTGASSQAQSFKKDSTSRNPQQEHHSEAFEMPATPMQLKPIPEQREKEASAGRRSTANNIQSFHEKQTPNNFQEAQSNNQEQEEAPKKLHIVGPNGIYQAPPPLRTQKTKTIPDSTNEIYELDSSLSHPHSGSHDIIAELSADIISAVEQIGGPNTILTTTTTPASSDRRAVSAPLQTPSQPQQQPPIEFTPSSQQKQFHAVPAPSAALPPSLVPGGRHGHHHSNSTSSIVSTSSSLQEAVNLYARLNSGYATPPFSEADEDVDSSEQQLRDWVCAEEELSKTAPFSSSSPPLTPAPLAVYKAYRPSAQQSQSQSQPQSRSASASPPVPAGSGAATGAEQVGNDAHGRRRYYSDMHVRESLQHDFRVTAQQEQHLSVDPNLLAMEYRAALPQFEQGYAS